MLDKTSFKVGFFQCLTFRFSFLIFLVKNLILESMPSPRLYFFLLNYSDISRLTREVFVSVRVSFYSIKERLDFSCAMFGPDGGLVANAPHIPVHLGSMQETVQYQVRTTGEKEMFFFPAELVKEARH